MEIVDGDQFSIRPLYGSGISNVATSPIIAQVHLLAPTLATILAKAGSDAEWAARYP